MKRIKLLSLVLGTTLLVTIGGRVTLAATYESATEAKSNGKIEFIDTDPEIVDPVDPDVPVDPEDKPNENKNDLMIQYVSDFDFAKHKKTVSAFNTNALPDKVKTKGDEDAKYRDVPSFVSTWDLRTNRNSGWALTVTSSEFISSNSSAHKIAGAEVVLSNAHYADGKETDDFKPEVSPEFKNGLVLTPGTEKLIATASEKEKQGIGSYSLAFGNVTDGVVDGVTFKMPGKTAVDSAVYSATFTWELKPEVSEF